MWEYNYNDELYHYGVLGMRWGIRRSKSGSSKLFGKKRKNEPEIHDDYKKAHDKKSVKSMSDAELKARNNRLQMEQQYATMTKKTNKGKKIVKSLIAAAGTIAAAETAYKTYSRIGKKVVDKVGDFVMKDFQKSFSKGL